MKLTKSQIKEMIRQSIREIISEGEDENKYYDYIGRSLGSLKEKYGLD